MPIFSKIKVSFNRLLRFAVPWRLHCSRSGEARTDAVALSRIKSRSKSSGKGLKCILHSIYQFRQQFSSHYNEVFFCFLASRLLLFDCALSASGRFVTSHELDNGVIGSNTAQITN